MTIGSKKKRHMRRSLSKSKVTLSERGLPQDVARTHWIPGETISRVHIPDKCPKCGKTEYTVYGYRAIRWDCSYYNAQDDESDSIDNLFDAMVEDNLSDVPTADTAKCNSCGTIVWRANKRSRFKEVPTKDIIEVEVSGEL